MVANFNIYRLFELVADDNAISDTVYFLAKALNSERIDLATFMKVNMQATVNLAQFSKILSFIVHTNVIKGTIYEESINQENHAKYMNINKHKDNTLFRDFDTMVFGFWLCLLTLCLVFERNGCHREFLD